MTGNDILFSKFSGPAAILHVTDDKITVADINDRYLNEVGMNVAPADYLKTDFEKEFDEPNLLLYKSAISRCIDGEEDVTIDTVRNLYMNCCGDNVIHIRSRFVLLDTTDGVSEIYEDIRNVTNQKLDDLLESERRFKIASDQINIYYWEYTIATKEMRPCFRCMRDLGLPALVRNYPEPVIEAGIFPADYADMYRDWHKQVAQGVKELEAVIPLTIGRVPFRVRYTTEFDENGTPVKAYGSATLVAEEELNRGRLDRSIIETLSERYSSICLVDIKANTVTTLKADNALGISTPNEVFSYDHALTLLDPSLASDAPDVYAQMNSLENLKTLFFKEAKSREAVYKRKSDGLWIRLTAQVVELSDDEVSKVLFTFTIIDQIQSEKLDADMLIEKQKAELEDRQVMLIKAVEEANKANEAKTVFFSSMSHDIRTPLNAITGFLKLAQDEIDDREAVKSYLQNIEASSNHLLELINDILDISRIESGKIELSKDCEDINEVFTEVSDIMKPQMESKNITFAPEFYIIHSRVYCDRLRIKQVLLNILSNAYKFTPEGGMVSYSVREFKTDSAPVYEIRVKDTGIGMTEDFKNHIFEAFTRDNTKNVSEIQGTGLGMSIVKRIVNMLHGTIEVESELNKGSEFIIRIPLETCQDAGVSTGSNIAAAADSYDFTGKTLLLVDDAAINRMVACKFLIKHGFKIIEASNGIEAINIVEKSSPGDISLVLMDVMMPVMNGLEATRRIRSLENKALADIPIVAMTANAFDEDIKATKDAGMNGHITKPFDREALLREISIKML